MEQSQARKRAVGILKERGLLSEWGAKSELARLMGVTRQYVNELTKKTDGTACFEIQRGT